jgi:exodeoxyribonuclease III
MAGPPGRPCRAPVDSGPMRLATWNVNSLKTRLERVLAWTERHQPDVLCLQETKVTDEQAPLMDFSALGYELVHHGPGRWNGVAIASRIGISDVVAGLPTPDGWVDDGGRFLAATCGPMRVATIYVPNGRVVDSEFYLEKLEWLARLSVWLNDNDPTTELAICGDYNVAPEDIDVWDVNAVHGATHVSPRERAAVAKLREWGMVDIVRHFHPEPGFFSWWDYRAGHFHKNFGMRIDHVYLSPPLAARAVAAERDRDARKPSTYPGIPSDHAPLIVDFRD